MKFKQPQMEDQYDKLPHKLQDVCNFFLTLSEEHLVEPLVTRVTDPVVGESGVHPAHRAVDFRNQYFDGKNNVWLYNQETIDEILKAVNNEFPRTDGRLVAIHHSFQGGMFHFHLQIPIGWLTQEENSRIYGVEDH